MRSSALDRADLYRIRAGHFLPIRLIRNHENQPITHPEASIDNLILLKQKRIPRSRTDVSFVFTSRPAIRRRQHSNCPLVVGLHGLPHRVVVGAIQTRPLPFVNFPR
ncbi:unnamed protein product [Nippostrongylus brasiliensis]|uniref:Uncharacterized protein n=1 Tax=Nippostrongylus brasiliensis TaxID=27835 RepID=A0A0N4XG25_NIPBR|nr:unnamed protein product [Nippostrongylus brasiliensis]